MGAYWFQGTGAYSPESAIFVFLSIMHNGAISYVPLLSSSNKGDRGISPLGTLSAGIQPQQWPTQGHISKVRRVRAKCEVELCIPAIRIPERHRRVIAS